MAQDSVGVGLVGCGTVGSGVVKLLVEEADLYAQRLGKRLEIRSVLCRAEDVGEATAQVPDGTLIHDLDAFFNTPDMDVVLELAGGTTFAKSVVERALTAGKHVITANKALLSLHGPELFALARSNNVSIAYEASSLGGCPVITALQHNLAGNRVTAMYGIFNGTCNYILTQMIGTGQSYAEALADAQKLGYAEADPTLDVSGGDTMHKLVILASMAFGARVEEEHVPCTGIDTLDLFDIDFGAEMGYGIKLLAIAEQTDAGLALSVGPCFVHADEPIAQVGGSFNAMSLYGHAVGHTFYYGRGAGQMPTASAVVGDLLNVAAGGYTALFENMTTWADRQPAPKLADPDAVTTRYYLRMNVMDRPGVLANITRVLGEHGVSIAAVNQHEENTGQFVPLVVITHESAAGALRRSAEAIAQLEDVSGEPIAIRIVDMSEG